MRQLAKNQLHSKPVSRPGSSTQDELQFRVPTIVQSVENWYGSNVDRLKTEGEAHSIRLQASADLVHGKVEIRAKSSAVAASVTLWNTGDGTVLRIDLPAKWDSFVDDRKNPQRVLASTSARCRTQMLVRFDMRWIEAVRTHFERAVARDT